MIKKENKLIQITLDPENQQLLNSLADRFHCSKTDVIKQALKVFAAAKKHHITLHYTSSKIIDPKELSETDKQEVETMLNELSV